MQSGYTVDRILEISDEIKQTNCYHFVRNFPNIPIILPSEWKSEGYVDTLAKNGEYDLFFANNPCSGLSRININASADNDVNHYFYDVIDKKYKQWKNTEWEKYMRPSTLFNKNHFENYLNEKVYFKGNCKTSYSSKPNFDNTADYQTPKGVANMNKAEKINFITNDLAHDENGNLIKF